MCEIEIIFSDAHLLAVHKPSGLLTVPGIGPDKQDCLIARVQIGFPTARIVHRLDGATSGVLVLALDDATQRDLSRMFQDRQVGKTYIALVASNVRGEAGEINLPLRLDIEHRRRTHSPLYIVDHEFGKPSLTRWRLIERCTLDPGAEPAAQQRSVLATTRLELNPITGRSHQLRVHLSAIGHPILGDDIYAPLEVRDAAPRLMLHAEGLDLTHPATGAPMHFTSPCPF